MLKSRRENSAPCKYSLAASLFLPPCFPVRSPLVGEVKIGSWHLSFEKGLKGSCAHVPSCCFLQRIEFLEKNTANSASSYTAPSSVGAVFGSFLGREHLRWEILFLRIRCNPLLLFLVQIWYSLWFKNDPWKYDFLNRECDSQLKGEINFLKFAPYSAIFGRP